MTAEDEAKQLDSVTDRVQEHETLDSSKAKTAMAALTSGTKIGEDHKKLAKIKISKEDVLVIVDELEVTEDIAARALREVMFEGIEDGKTPLGEAMRRLLVA
mmetsp:Transcript_18696/g.23538  ORF Transcript_18696/g.23538 Transcript_18696/m.23538 type:complete len:102 (+) Transcript_18696:56-361(+)|eukprot:CAMPEP_0203690834 /NCGR_PEP_ID=MMETSP0091-20130426/3186_1 /ASSEMBLY_ACC=CAM_ASM_001089 /TAXON_ID=426623 /ORGANISM="Chaetoceros affinis, Strain CCMP159" /LENGTH=101 /DNA_ID=CAMNT_0050561121 /DNA_START=56 /DNA_END=361 /DNA_ORIENTATION=-